MSQTFSRNPLFTTDVQNRFSWYWDEAGEEVAWRFEAAVEKTLLAIARQPGLGRIRRFRHPNLRGLRAYHVAFPFEKLLLFYRANAQTIEAWRLMHGSRDLPHRLLESPRPD